MANPTANGGKTGRQALRRPPFATGAADPPAITMGIYCLARSGPDSIVGFRELGWPVGYLSFSLPASLVPRQSLLVLATGGPVQLRSATKEGASALCRA